MYKVCKTFVKNVGGLVGFKQVFENDLFTHNSSTIFSQVFTITLTHTKLTFSSLLNGLFSTTSTTTITRIIK